MANIDGGVVKFFNEYMFSKSNNFRSRLDHICGSKMMAISHHSCYTNIKAYLDEKNKRNLVYFIKSRVNTVKFFIYYVLIYSPNV